MIDIDTLIDQQILLAVLILGTLICYLFIPIPNIIYKEHMSQKQILNFDNNSGCYGLNTEEVDCPLHDLNK